jgi:hypothetical protein
MQSVGMHDDQRFFRQWIRKLLQARRVVTGGAIVRDHQQGLAYSGENSPYVADSCIPDLRAGLIDRGDRHRRATCAPQRTMNFLQNCRGCHLAALPERRDGFCRSPRRQRAVAQTVSHDQVDRILPLREGPGVAADFFSHDGL